MFNKSKSDAVTHSDLSEYARSYLTRDDAEIYSQDVSQMLAALDARVSELEGLARTLRQSGGVSAPAARTQGATDALTKTDAAQALDQLKRLGAAEFEKLNAKIDEAVRRIGGLGPAVRAASRQESSSNTAIITPDYGAVAFGLSEISRKVGEVLAGTPGMDREYEGAVQYFADVFAKSDPEFDADAFKRQAGVTDGGNGSNWTPAHP